MRVARLTSEAVSAVNVDELRPPARHAETADRPRTRARTPPVRSARCASPMRWFRSYGSV